MKTAQRTQAHALAERPLPTPREIFSYLDAHVVGQERAKRTVAIAAYNHLKRCTLPAGRKKLVKKSNILLIGPTGSGKTHIARKLADCLSVPLSIADATEYTEAGYYGKDIEVMVAELLFRANHSIEATQRGIIFIDELDKIARRSHGARTGGGNRDIGGEGVQQALLKLLEGREMFVPMNVTQHWNKHDFVQVDTADILFIAAGTFSDLHERGQRHSVGFGRGGGGERGAGAGAAEQRRVTTQDLLDFGMLAELLGRLPVVVQLDPLSEEQLVQVMTGPPDSLVREYTHLMELDSVGVRFDQAALQQIARFATQRRIGARGLRAIFEEVCHDLMFEAPERRGEVIEVGQDYVDERLGRIGAG